MTIFQTIVLVLFVTSLAAKFVIAAHKELFSLMLLFGFELVAFAYLASELM